MQKLALRFGLMCLLLPVGQACAQDSPPTQAGFDWDRRFGNKATGFANRIGIRLRFIPSFNTPEQVDIAIPPDGSPWLEYSELPFEPTDILAGSVAKPKRRSINIRSEDVLRWLNQIMAELAKSAPVLTRKATASLKEQYEILLDGTEYECVVKTSTGDTEIVWRSNGPELMPGNHERGSSMVELMRSIRQEANKLLAKGSPN